MYGAHAVNASLTANYLRAKYYLLIGIVLAARTCCPVG
jgi:hypothetical protein